MLEENSSFISKFLNNSSRKYTLLIIISYLAVITFIILANRFPIFTHYTLGESARSSVVSSYTFPYYDKSDTRAMMEYLSSTEPYYYTSDKNHLQKFQNRLSEVMKSMSVGSDKNFRESMKKLNMGFSSDVWSYIQHNRFLLARYEERMLFLYQSLTIKYTIVDSMPRTSTVKHIVLKTDNDSQNIYFNNIITMPVDKNTLSETILANFPRLSRLNREAIAEIMLNIVQANATLDTATRERILQEKLKLKRQQKVIRKGESLLKQGQQITIERLAKLEAYQEYRDDLLSKKLLTYILISLSIFILLIYRLFKFESKFFLRKRNISVALLFFVISNLLFYIANTLKPGINLAPYLLIPFGIISITLPELIQDKRITVILLFSYILFMFFYPSFEILSFLNLLIISLSTIYTHALLKTRTHYFLVGALIGGINLIFVLLDQQFNGLSSSMNTFLILSLFAVGNGLVSAMISLGLLPIFEKIFNVPTRFRLLELSNPTLSPLLKKLKVEAPGTYNHSMLIGDMCSEAAEDLGINSLLIRVGGYYHDIGKMENSNYFIENQEGKNKHDDIKPNMSVAVIKAHVKIGLELAHQYKLPEELIAYILEHHGTTAISYFYHQALGLLGDENVNMEDYQYQGPRPASKGTALLMIADTVEATVRAYSQNKEKFTPKIVQEIIDDTVEKRMEQGQFENCDITLAELTRIKHSFFKHLSAYYHKRIEYPGGK